MLLLSWDWLLFLEAETHVLVEVCTFAAGKGALGTMLHLGRRYAAGLHAF